MSRELRNELVCLLGRERTSVMEEVNASIAKYTEKDLREAVLLKDCRGQLPIHMACKYGAPLEIIQLLLDSDVKKKSISEKVYWGSLPLHLACDGGASAEVIRLLLDSDTPNKSIFEKDNNGRLPIHLACKANAPIEVIQWLLERDDNKKSILVKDNIGKVPLHLACKANAPVEVIQLLLDSDHAKKSIFERDSLDRLPLHYACWKKNASVEVIQLLLDSDVGKKSILEKDQFGRLPIHKACEGAAPVEAIQRLLQVSLCDRIKQLGLPQWKRDVEERIKHMTADDSRKEKVAQIYEKLSKYEEMEHTLSVLALAAWRTSCLHWGDIEFQSMQEMEDLRVTDETFDPEDYKRVSRIKSGADVVIRGVLPFL